MRHYLHGFVPLTLPVSFGQIIKSSSYGGSIVLLPVSIPRTWKRIEHTMTDCGTAVDVVLILTPSALLPYQKRQVVRFVISSTTAAAYSIASILGIPSFPWALPAMVLSMLLYRDCAGSWKLPKYV